MKQISNKEYEKYQRYLTDQLHGRTLTPDGLRMDELEKLLGL